MNSLVQTEVGILHQVKFVDRIDGVIGSGWRRNQFRVGGVKVR